MPHDTDTEPLEGKAARRDVPELIAESVDTVASLHARAQGTITVHQRSIELLTTTIGRPRTLYAILSVVLLWVVLNVTLQATLGRSPDPPPFVWLQGAVSLSALLMATIVLITQNRQTRHAEQRAALELQLSLLAERKSAKLVELVEELRKDLPIRDRVDPEAEAMKHSLDPHAMISKLEETLEPGPREPEQSAGLNAAPPEPQRKQ